MKIGEKIKLLRTEQKLTQPDLAQKAGIEQSYLSKLENDKAIPSFDIINRVAMALGTTGMELIDSLSLSYVEKNLSHIPQVAAEYAVVKKKRESILKKRFIMASLIVFCGISLVLISIDNLIFTENFIKYESLGIIKDNELDQQFSSRNIRDILEDHDALKLRVSNNASRINRIFKLVHGRNDEEFVEKVDGGRRLYTKIDEVTKQNKYNNIMLLIGKLLIVSGIFVFLYNFRFKPE